MGGTLTAPPLEAVDQLLKGIADPVRLRIVNLLADGALCVCDIVEIIELPQPTVSRHLAYLRRCGIVDAERRNRFAHYRLSGAPSGLLSELLELLSTRLVTVPGLRRERRAAGDCRRRREAAPC